MRVRRLDRYVAAQFASSWAIWLFFMTGLMIVFDIFANLDRFAEAAENLPGISIPSAVFRYYTLNAVFVFLELAPFITVTAGMFTITRLMKHNEIVAMVMTGTSLFRVFVPVLAGGVAAAGLMAGTRELVLPGIRPEKERLEQIVLKGRREKVRENLFCADPAGRLVSLDTYAPQSGVIQGLSLLALGGLADDWERITASRAEWVEGKDGPAGWRLEGGRRVGPGPGGGLQAETIAFLPSAQLDPAFLLREIKKGREFYDFSFTELAELARLRPDYPTFRVLLHYHLTFPLANLLLLLLTLPLGVNFERRSTLEGVILAVVVCAVYLGLDLTLRNLGSARLLHPIVAAWAAPVLFGSAGAVLFGSVRS